MLIRSPLYVVFVMVNLLYHASGAPRFFFSGSHHFSTYTGWTVCRRYPLPLLLTSVYWTSFVPRFPRDVPACSCVTLPIFCGLCLQYTTLCTNCQPLSRRIQGQHFLFPSWRGSAPGFPPGRAQSAMGFHHCEGNTLRFCRFCLPVSHGHSSSASLRWAPSPGEGKALLGRKCAEVSQNSF